MISEGSALPRARARPRLLLINSARTRAGVRAALEGAADVFAAASSDEAIAIATRYQPDICIVGFEGPSQRVSTVRAIAKASPRTVVIVMADSPEADDLLASVRAGAIGYLPVTIVPTELRRALSALMAGEAAIPRGMVTELVRELQNTVATSVPGLTQRESQVFAMARRGYPTAAIARRLGIAPVTVRRHISAILHKTGLRDRAALEQEDVVIPPVQPARQAGG